MSRENELLVREMKKRKLRKRKKFRKVKKRRLQVQMALSLVMGKWMVMDLGLAAQHKWQSDRLDCRGRYSSQDKDLEMNRRRIDLMRSENKTIEGIGPVSLHSKPV